MNNIVNLETVKEFTNGLNVTSSYVQDNRHSIVTDKFKVIQPASVGHELSKLGFKCTSILTGKAKQVDKADFQKTIARYRSTEKFEIDGLSLDIIYISKHMGRGTDELRLGLYRGVCANQWAVGTLFDMIKIRHSGNPLEDIEVGITAILKQRNKLVTTIKAMQDRVLTKDEIELLARKYASIRLQGKKNIIDADFKSLAQIRRSDDAKIDLFTVANVLQENVIRFPMRYDMNSMDKNGQTIVRKQTTQILKESSSQLVDMNGQFFDAAMELVA